MKDVYMILAIGKDGSIGRQGDLIWHIPSDLKRFKALTMGHPVIMGRKTWESLPKKPLPGRTNIVLTRNKDYKAEGAIIATTPEEALKATGEEIPFIMGGAEIYKLFMPKATRLYLTEIDDVCKDADAFLDTESWSSWNILETSPEENTPEGLAYRYVTLQKV